MAPLAEDTMALAKMEQEHLLEPIVADEDGDDSVTASEYNHKPRSRISRRRATWWIVAIHGLILIVYSIIFVASLRAISHHEHCGTSKPSDVFQAIDGLDIVFKQSNTEVREMSGYYGRPNAEIDHRWKELLRSRFIAVSRAELKRSERISVAIRPGGPYLAWLGIFHELHCLDYVRKFVHREHYFPNMTAHDHYKSQNHVDHCMDRIQAILMCHPDYSTLTTMRWSDHDKPMVDRVRTMRSCVDWDRLVGSLQARVVPEKDLKQLRKPSIPS